MSILRIVIGVLVLSGLAVGTYFAFFNHYTETMECRGVKVEFKMQRIPEQIESCKACSPTQCVASEDPLECAQLYVMVGMIKAMGGCN